ncbi:hypothetical protein [Actinokineospora bangkokensis]|uniref:Uncharacterized protein n=1 Tax=Actinokineospora bangkokensis TaxID=1193682 RepID=A0A1Q9LC17_9PSEU|nr:hypothetical protein [Actinokineospora bangkokensis]OLR89559.1 hypothetical protein BJP25_05640 [Actinokineospora bangkokensis]
MVKMLCRMLGWITFSGSFGVRRVRSPRTSSSAAMDRNVHSPVAYAWNAQQISSARSSSTTTVRTSRPSSLSLPVLR